MARALRHLNRSRGAVLEHSRDLRARGVESPTCEDLGRAGLYQLGLSYAVDDLVALAGQALEDARLPWYRRVGFVPGVFVGIGVSAALLALWLEVA